MDKHCQLILEVAEQNNVLPDYRQVDNEGHNAYHMLQVHAGEAINIEFAAAIGITLTKKFSGSVYTQEEYADMQKAADEYFKGDRSTRIHTKSDIYTDAEYEDLQKAADEYFAEKDDNSAYSSNEYDHLKEQEDNYFNNNPNHRLISKLDHDKKIYTALVDNSDDIFAEVDALLKSFSFMEAKSLGFTEALKVSQL